MKKNWIYIPYGRVFNNLTIADTFAGGNKLKNVKGEK